MSDETPGRWFEIGEASLAVTDRLLWLSLVLAVVGAAGWQIAHNDFWKDEEALLAAAPPEFAHPKSHREIDYFPTASVRRRKE
ncbi:hypothetical protein [Methylocystis parvus]|uniref:Uncharacterized protein n=1 Tax=Methylocystis parvus TaxID=134 RepID=A0A6B8M1A6_9HYPH|nr:hypothetical protein [Methylocystis parvus]QGM96072.1 hypothetical protein F7D14_00200 [Methylocystis parvus]WBK00110.1 hypothetical protein MMG94_19415 [Methylocystis parvus OBBP]